MFYFFQTVYILNAMLLSVKYGTEYEVCWLQTHTTEPYTIDTLISLQHINIGNQDVHLLTWPLQTEFKLVIFKYYHFDIWKIDHNNFVTYFTLELHWKKSDLSNK